MSAVKPTLPPARLPQLPESLLCNRREAAALLNCSVRSVQNLEAAGKLRAVRLAGRGRKPKSVRYVKSDVLSLIYAAN
jgi:excisionase family DNA binding protein